MQAVILAAGRGTRMEELTTAVPKPMLLVDGKTLLEHKLDALPDEIQEVVIIVGHLSDVIKMHYTSTYRGRTLTYVEQTELNGTAGAPWAAEGGFKNKIFFFYCDDIFFIA